MRAAPPGSDTVLVMADSPRTAALLAEYLGSRDPRAERGRQGRRMLERKLKLYLWWKRKRAERKTDGRAGFAMPARAKDFSAQGKKERGGAEGVSEALRRKDRQTQERNASRRRTRGGAPAGAAGGGRVKAEEGAQAETLGEAEDVADL